MTFFITKLKNNTFIRNFSLIISGNLINQIVLLLSYPIISRLYSPSQIGLFAQLQAIFQITILIGTLKYEQAIIISENEEEERKLVSVSFYILIFISFLTMIPFVFFSDISASLLKNKEIKFWLFLIPIFTFLGGLQLILNNLSVKNKLFKFSNYSNILLSSSNSIFKILFGIKNLTYLGLFISRLLSFALSVLIFFISKLRIKIYSLTKKNIIIFVHTIKKYKAFPLYLNTSNFVNMLSISLLSILISRYWTVKALGLFSMANATLNLPISMIKKTFQTVYYQRASELINKHKNLFRDYKKLISVLTFFSFFPLLIMYFWADNIYAIFLGEKWLEAGKIARYISPWLLSTLIATPATVIIPVLNIQKYLLFLQLAILITRLALLIFLYNRNASFYFTIKMLSIHGVLFNTFHIFFVWNRLKRNVEKDIR